MCHLGCGISGIDGLSRQERSFVGMKLDLGESGVCLETCFACMEVTAAVRSLGLMPRCPFRQRQA